MKPAVTRNFRRGRTAQPIARTRRPRPLGVSLARYSSIVAVCAIVIAGTEAGQAATYYWDQDSNPLNDSPALGLIGAGAAGTGLGGTGAWDASSLFWFRAPAGAVAQADIAWPNLSTDIADFMGTAGTVTLDSAGINAGAVQFFTTGYTLTGGGATGLTLGTGGGPSNTNVFVGSALATTISSVISGSNGLALGGGGTLTINTAEAYTGNTTLNSGSSLTLDFTAVGAPSTNMVGSGSPLVLNNGTLTVKSGAGLTNSQAFAGTTVAGRGVITLTPGTLLTTDLGAITHTVGGTLQFTTTPNATTDIAATSNTNVNGIVGPWAFTSSGVNNQRYVTVTGGQILAFTGTTAAAAGLTDTMGAVNYELSAGSGTAGANFSGNTIRYNTASTATAVTGSGSFTINGLLNANTGVLTLNGTGITIGSTNELVVNPVGAVVFSTAIGGAAGAGLTIGGGGASTVTLNAVSTYTGKTTVNTGSLVLGIANAINSASNVVVNGGTLSMLTFADAVNGVSLTSGTISGTTSVLTSSTAFDVQSGSITTNLAGTAGLVKTTAGTVVVNGANALALTGGITIKAGVLQLGGSANVNEFGTNLITLGDTSGSADARLLYSGTTASYSNAILLSTGTTGQLSIGTTNASTGVTFTGGITGSNNITFTGASSTGTLTFNTVAINNAGSITNAASLAGTGTGATIIALPLGSLVTGINQSSATTPLTFTMASGVPITSAAGVPINITAGTLNYGISGTATVATNILGTGALTITPGATLNISTGSSAFNDTLGNAITIPQLAGTATIITSGGITDSNSITFGTGGSGTPILKLTNTNGTLAPLTFSGAISGTGNIQLNPTGTNAPVTLSGPQNQTGTISNIGTATATTSVSTLSGAIGSGITGLSQAGANPFTVSSVVPMNASLNTFTSTGSGTFTFSNANTFTGTQPLTFNANSSGAITISGTNLNHTGTITNSGTGSGTTTISSAIGANVTGVIQNSATSPLFLNGSNPNFAGTYTATTGLLEFATQAAMTGYPGTPSAVKVSVASGGLLGLGYGSAGQFQEADVNALLTGAGTTYPNLSFAATGAAVALDTGTASASYTSVLANAAGTTSFGLVKLSGNTLTLGNSNTFTGPVAIYNGILKAGILNSVTTPAQVAASSLGVPSSVAIGTISLGLNTNTGALSYTGPGETTDRVINLAGTTGGGTLENAGSGTLTFSSPMTFTGTGAKTLFLQATSGDLVFGGNLAGGISTAGAPLTITKTGSGTVTLNGTTNSATALNVAGTFDIGAGGLTLSNTGNNTLQGTANAAINATGGGVLTLGFGSVTDGANVGAANGTTLTINAQINMAGPFENFAVANGTGVTVLTAQNTYTGNTLINSSVLSVANIGNQGSLSSNLGAGTTITIQNALSTLRYTGTGETSNRIINLGGTTTGGIIDQSGPSGLLKFTAGFATPGAGAKILTVQGSTAGAGEIAGAIVDSGTNTTGLTKAGTGTWTLSGVNTYTGATTVNAGNLILSTGTGTGVLSNSAIIINSLGTLSPLAGYFAGNTGTALKGATVALNAGGVLNLADGVIGNFNLLQNTTFAGNAATFSGGALNFDINASAADQIDVRLNNVAGTGQATSSGSNAISIVPVAGTASLTPVAYTLINAGAVGSTLANTNFYLASPNLLVGGTLYSLTLSGTTGTEVVTVAVNGGAASTPNSAFWTGALGAGGTGSWATGANGGLGGVATNWSASALGTPDTFALPGATTNVTLTANTAANLLTTLDQNFTINSLTFSGTGSSNTAGSTIASGTGTNSLTINAAALNGNPAGNGITVNPGSGTDTISANVILGTSQTFTNNSSSTLTLSGVVSDAGGNLNLTIAGSGTTALTNAANTYGGITTINAGVLSVATLANGSSPSGIGQSSNAASNLVFGGSGSLQYTGGNVVIDRSLTINAGVTGTIEVTQAGTTLELPGATGVVTTGLLTKAGPGALTLNGANTYTGNTTVANGTLNIGGTGSLTGLAASSKLNINPTSGNNGVVNYTSSGTSTLFAVTGATVAGTASAFNQSNGVVNITPGTGTGTQSVAGGVGSYGYYNISGGTFRDTTGTTGGARFTVSNAGGTAPITSGITGAGVVTAVMNVGGTGFIDHTNAEWWLNYGLGQVTVTDSGKIDHTGSSTYFALFMDSTVTGGSYGVLNLAGANAQVITGAQPIRFGNSTSNGSGNSGFVNLAAGILSTGANASTSLNASGANSIYYNFAGGTLKATGALSQFAPTSNAAASVVNTIYGAVNNSAVTGAPSFNGGLTIDTNSFTVTIPAAMPLLGATGNRVTQADLTVTGGSGYIGAPAVIFSKPTSAGGVPASGYALMSAGSVLGIVITDPGVYGSETPTITLVGGGATVPATVTSGLLATANSNTGGLTKLNTGTLTISASNTFGGPVDIKGGLLTTTLLANGGSASGIGQSSNAAANLLLDGGILGYNGTVAGATDRNFTYAANNSGLDASGTTLGTFTLTSANAMTVAPSLGAVNFLLQGTGTLATGSGFLGTLISDGGGTTLSVVKSGTGTWNLTNSGNTYNGATVINSGILSVSTLGTAGVGGTPSALGASSNAAGNLVINGGTLQYTGAGATTDRNYTFGNATTASGGAFDATGATGPFVISGSMTGVNTAANTQVLTLTSLAASGANALNGAISDSSGTALTGVTKSGVGAWTLGGANAYSGLTTVNAGTLNITGTNANASALTFTSGGNGIVNINSSGTVAAGTITWAGATGGVLNLLGGTLLENAGGLTSASSTVNALSFNGGTLKSSAPFAISGSLNINIQAGGGTIDTTGGNITSASGIANTASPGTLNVIGGNTLQSAVNATMTGLVNITGAGTTLKLVTTAAVYPNRWTVGTGATLDINNVGNFSFGGLAGGGTVLNTGASAVRTITITGTGGNNFSGSIQQPTPSTTLATGVTLNLSTPAATQTFSGANTYGGPTTITQGKLALTGGSLGNTAISIAANGTFMPIGAAGSYTAGTTGPAALGASLNVAGNGTVSLLDGLIGTFTLNQQDSFATAALTLATSNLNLELSSAGPDQIVVSGGAVSSAISGTNTITITGLGSSLTPGTYSLLTAPGIAAGNTLFKFGNGTADRTITVGLLTYGLTLTSITGVEQLLVGNGVGTFTWTGQTGGTGAANSIWTGSAAGNNNFADLSPAVADYSEGSAVIFQDLNTIANANVANSTVTIGAAGVSPASVTVNNTNVNYTLQNASGNVGIAGATGLLKTGPGTLTILGLNTYTGATAINGGIVNVGVAVGAGFGPLGNGGIVSFGGGTLQYSAANQFDYSARFSAAAGELVSIDTNGQTVTFANPLVSPGGTLTKTGAGTLTLSAINTYSGNTTINGGTLTVTNANVALGALASPTITVNTGGVLDLTNNDTLGYTAGRNALVINGGTVQNNAANKRDTLINTVTMTGGFLAGTSLGDASSGAFSLNNATSVIATSDAAGNPATISANVSTQAVANFQVNRGSAVAAGAPDLLISGPITPYGVAGTNGITKTGAGIMTLSGANSYTGTTTLANGTLIIGATNTIKTTNQLTFGTAASANVGALQLNAFSQTLGTILVTSNAATPNTISIAGGQTLTTGTLTMGYDAGSGSGATLSNLTVSGGGTFAISGATSLNISVNQAATNAAYYSAPTLDVTGIASFTAAVTTFNIGVGSTTTGPGTLLLSNTANTITATTLQVGNSAGNNGNGTSLLQFGTGTNVINASTINLGYGKTSSNVNFLSHTLGSPGTLTIAGTAGGASTANITIASHNGTATANVNTVVFDVTGHTVAINAGTLQIGNANNASSGSAIGTLSFDAGTINALNTSVGLKSGTAGTGAGTGTLNIGGGTFTVGNGGNLVLATNTAATGSANGTVNITGSGTLLSNADITKGGGTNTTATLNLNGATALLDMSGGGVVHNIGSATNAINNFTYTNGNLQNIGTVFGNITLAGTGSRLFTETGSFSGEVRGVIAGTGLGLTKSGTGALALTRTNTYTGPTNVSGGTLEIAGGAGGSISTTSSLTVGSTATLLASNHTNNSLGSATTNVDLAGGTLQFTGSTVSTESLGQFKLSASSTLDLGNGVGEATQITFTLGYFAHTADTTALNIQNWNGTAATLGGASNDRLIFLGNDAAYNAFSTSFSQNDISFDGTPGYVAIQFGDHSGFEVVAAVPEPSSAAMLAATGLFGLYGYRARRRAAKRR